MRKLIAYIAISFNGKIADSDGGVEWLEHIPNPDESDFGYYKFYKSIDTTIQGHNTYKQVSGWDIPFPYPEKKNYVLSSDSSLNNNEDVEFITENHIEFIQSLKEQEGKDIWLIGGGITNTKLLNAKLVDEIIVHAMPIILAGGIDLFDSIPNETKLELLNSKAYKGGVLESHYSILK